MSGVNTSHESYDAIENLIFQENLRINFLEISSENDKVIIHLREAITFVVPTKNYRRLKNASKEHLQNYRLVADGVGIHWPDLDEDLSLKGFLQEFLRQNIKPSKELVLA